MSGAVFAWTALAGGVGALVRHELSGRVSARTGRPAVGTLTVNLLGTALLAWLLTRGTTADVVRVVGTGFCGGLTTFSTWMVQSLRETPGGDDTHRADEAPARPRAGREPDDARNSGTSGILGLIGAPLFAAAAVLGLVQLIG